MQSAESARAYVRALGVYALTSAASSCHVCAFPIWTLSIAQSWRVAPTRSIAARLSADALPRYRCKMWGVLCPDNT